MSLPRFLASFDIEDWFHAANLEGCLPSSDWEALEPRVERNAHELLDLLGDVGASSTFFVLGWVARRYPRLIERIVAEGHELASHSDLHRPLNALSRRDLMSDLRTAREALEQVGGVRVLGVRAPNFSLSDQVVDCLAESGYWYDSSFYALRVHDRYGRLSQDLDPEAPIVELRPGLLELPMSRLRVGPLALPWAGGAYFRLIPYPLFRLGVARRLRSQSWFMFYCHPWELDDEEARPEGLGAARRLRAYMGRGRVRRDLQRLLEEFGSARIDSTLLAMGYRPEPH